MQQFFWLNSLCARFTFLLCSFNDGAIQWEFVSSSFSFGILHFMSFSFRSMNEEIRLCELIKCKISMAFNQMSSCIAALTLINPIFYLSSSMKSITFLLFFFIIHQSIGKKRFCISTESSLEKKLFILIFVFFFCFFVAFFKNETFVSYTILHESTVNYDFSLTK